MEEQIKNILIEKLREKGEKKFNGYKLGLHANHIAVSILKKKGITKGSKEFEAEHSKIKELVKSIHKDLPAQDVSKKARSPAPASAPAPISPTQLAKETSSVQEETPSDELKAVKAELKQLKTLIASSKTIKIELADKIKDAYRRYKQMKEAKAELTGLKQKATDEKLDRIKGRLEVATAVKRVKKALTKNVEVKKAEKEIKEKEMKEKEMKEKEQKPKTLTVDEFRERLQKKKKEKKEKKEVLEKEKAPAPAPAPASAPLYDLKNELSMETVKEKYKALSDTQHFLIHNIQNYITPKENSKLLKQANNIYLEMLSIRHKVETDLKYDNIPIPSWAKHLASVIKQLIEGRPDFKNDKNANIYIGNALNSIKYILTH
jgi:hypothetical protein